MLLFSAACISMYWTRAVASLTVPDGQEFHFPHSFLKFRSIFLILPQTFLIFFLILVLRVGDSPTRKGPGYATVLDHLLSPPRYFNSLIMPYIHFLCTGIACICDIYVLYAYTAIQKLTILEHKNGPVLFGSCMCTYLGLEVRFFWFFQLFESPLKSPNPVASKLDGFKMQQGFKHSAC